MMVNHVVLLSLSPTLRSTMELCRTIEDAEYFTCRHNSCISPGLYLQGFCFDVTDLGQPFYILCLLHYMCLVTLWEEKPLPLNLQGALLEGWEHKCPHSRVCFVSDLIRLNIIIFMVLLGFELNCYL